MERKMSWNFDIVTAGFKDPSKVIVSTLILFKSQATI
jgi:hypothetical protein